MASASRKAKLALAMCSLLFTVTAIEIGLRALPARFLLLSGPPAYPGDRENRESKNFVADEKIWPCPVLASTKCGWPFVTTGYQKSPNSSCSRSSTMTLHGASPLIVTSKVETSQLF